MVVFCLILTKIMFFSGLSLWLHLRVAQVGRQRRPPIHRLDSKVFTSLKSQNVISRAHFVTLKEIQIVGKGCAGVNWRKRECGEEEQGAVPRQRHDGVCLTNS